MTPLVLCLQSFFAYAQLATELYPPITRLIPPQLLPNFDKISTYIVMENLSEAKAETEKLLLSYPDELGVQFLGHYVLGLIEFQLGNYLQSIDAYQYVVTHAPKDNPDYQYRAAIASYIIGVNYMQLKEYDKAFNQFLTVIQEYTDSVETPYVPARLMDCLEAKGEDTKKIESFFLDFISQYPQPYIAFEVYRQLACHYSRNRQYQKAINYWQKIIDEAQKIPSDTWDKYKQRDFDLKTEVERARNNILELQEWLSRN